MLGGIIGDIAASTWRSDRDTFYKRLTAPAVAPTQWGAIAYGMIQPTLRHAEVGSQMLYRHLSEQLKGVRVSEGMRDWLRHQCGSGGGYVRYGVATVLCALAGYASDDAEGAVMHARMICLAMGLDDRVHEASEVLPSLIASLRRGMTKDGALGALTPEARELMARSDKSDRGPMGVAARAWDAFYRAYDFTSAIHSAVKSPVDAHLTATVCGLLADAMYGSHYGMTKSEYAAPGERLYSIELPPQYEAWRHREAEIEHRVFWKKNWSLTNVDRHRWEPMPNQYEGQMFDGRYYSAILRSAGTGWENRYGIYLDEGWHYVYRSEHVLVRFVVGQAAGGMYEITRMEESDDSQGVGLIALPCALRAISEQAHGEAPQLVAATDYFDYYNGGCRCPYEEHALRNANALTAMRLWHGERLFLETHQDIRHWMEIARQTRPTAQQEALLGYFGDRGTGVLAVRLFIEDTYRRWHPQEQDCGWAFQAAKAMY